MLLESCKVNVIKALYISIISNIFKIILILLKKIKTQIFTPAKTDGILIYIAPSVYNNVYYPIT